MGHHELPHLRFTQERRCGTTPRVSFQNRELRARGLSCREARSVFRRSSRPEPQTTKCRVLWTHVDTCGQVPPPLLPVAPRTPVCSGVSVGALGTPGGGGEGAGVQAGPLDDALCHNHATGRSRSQPNVNSGNFVVKIKENCIFENLQLCIFSTLRFPEQICLRHKLLISDSFFLLIV